MPKLSMKKFLLLAFLFAGISAFAVETVSGDYVLYGDYSFTSPTWVGFLKYDDYRYAGLLYCPSEHRRIEVLFSVAVKDGKMELTGQNVPNEISYTNKADVEAVNYLMRLLPDMYKWSRLVPATSGTKQTNAVSAVCEYFGGKVTVQSDFYIPLFSIKTVKNQKQTLLNLERIGRVMQNDTEFFKLQLPFPKERPSDAEIKTNLKKKIVKAGPVKIRLDEQWTAAADNLYLLGDSALLTIAPLKKSPATTAGNLVKFFCLSDSQRTVMLDQMKFTGNEKKFTCTNAVYDNETQAVNIDIKTIVLQGDMYTVVSLTVREQDYKKYKTYFDNLF